MTALLDVSDVLDAGYVIAPDGDGWTLLTPPAGTWRGIRPPGVRDVAYVAFTVSEAWDVAVEVMQAEVARAEAWSDWDNTEWWR